MLGFGGSYSAPGLSNVLLARTKPSAGSAIIAWKTDRYLMHSSTKTLLDDLKKGQILEERRRLSSRQANFRYPFETGLPREGFNPCKRAHVKAGSGRCIGEPMNQSLLTRLHLLSNSVAYLLLLRFTHFARSSLLQSVSDMQTHQPQPDAQATLTYLFPRD